MPKNTSSITKTETNIIAVPFREKTQLPESPSTLLIFCQKENERNDYLKLIIENNNAAILLIINRHPADRADGYLYLCNTCLFSCKQTFRLTAESVY